MGNLPFANTITINTGEPIPPTLMMEFQDMWTGDKYTTRKSVIRCSDPDDTVPYLATTGFDGRCWLINDVVPYGATIRNIRTFVTDSATGPTIAIWQFGVLVPASTGTAFTQLGVTASSLGNGTYQNIPIGSGLPRLVSPGELYIFKTALASGGAVVHQWYIEIEHDRL